MVSMIIIMASMDRIKPIIAFSHRIFYADADADDAVVFETETHFVDVNFVRG